LIISGLTGGGVVFFAFRSWCIHTKLASIEKERQKIRYDPDLYLAGPQEHRFAWAPNEIKHIWKRKIFLCNPGDSPALVRSLTYRSGATGSTLPMTVFGLDEQGVESIAEPPILIDGHSGKLLVFRLEDQAAVEIRIVYSTAKTEEKLLAFPTLLASLETRPE